MSALSELTEHYGSAITRMAYLQLGDAHAAEDVAQETLLAAWDGVHRTRPDTALWPWLLGITYNHCRKHWRSVTRRRRREQTADHLCKKHRDSVHVEQSAIRLETTRKALSSLSPKLRIVILLRYFEGLSIRETADALDLPQGTVKRRCHVAIEKLRELINEVPS